MEDIKCVRPDYESECKRLTELNHQLEMKLSNIESYCKGREMEFNRMKAQLDIVYLIFGNGR